MVGTIENIRKSTAVNNPQEHQSATATSQMISPAQHPTLNPTTNSEADMIESKSTKRDLVRFFHVCCFFPVISTWIVAMHNENYASYPGLSSTLLARYLHVELPTSQGHMHKRNKTS